jgi:S1-C subfamily serine protease
MRQSFIAGACIALAVFAGICVSYVWEKTANPSSAVTAPVSSNTNSDTTSWLAAHFEKVHNYIILVGYKNDKKEHVWVGSGGVVIVKENNVPSAYVLTAAHVVRYITAELQKEDIYIGTTTLSAVFPTKIVLVGPEHDEMADYAILRIKCTTADIGLHFGNEGLRLSKHTLLDVGKEIVLVGNMLADCAPVSVSYGRILHTTPKWPLYHVYADYASLPGTSGSPVFNKEGKVIGIHVASLFNKVSLFVDLYHVRKAAEAEGLGFLWNE